MVLVSRDWKISCDEPDTRTTKGNSLLCWDPWCWSAGTEKWRWNILESVSWESLHRSHVFEVAKVVHLAAELGSVRGTLMVSILNMWRGHGEQPRLGPVWQGWSPWKEPMRGCGWKCNPVAAEGPSILEMSVCVMDWPLRLSAAVKQHQPEPSVSLCGARGVTQALWKSPEGHSRHCIIYTVGNLVWLWFNCDCALVFPSWVRKYLT